MIQAWSTKIFEIVQPKFLNIFIYYSDESWERLVPYRNLIRKSSRSKSKICHFLFEFTNKGGYRTKGNLRFPYPEALKIFWMPSLNTMGL